MKQLATGLAAIILVTACSKSKNDYKNYNVNNATSVAEWKGSAPDHFHVGSFEVKGAMSATPSGKIQSGKFVIPIASIKNFDLDEPLKDQLLTHLKSVDFFNMAVHPNAEFEITGVDNYTGGTAGAIEGANKLVTGNFKMIGQTHPISIAAKVLKVGDSLKVESKFKLDRTKWGMTSYTDPNAGMTINPDVDIHLKIQAAR